MYTKVRLGKTIRWRTPLDIRARTFEGDFTQSPKPAFSDHSNIDKTLILKTSGSLMLVEHSAILLTRIKRLSVLKTYFRSWAGPRIETLKTQDCCYKELKTTFKNVVTRYYLAEDEKVVLIYLPRFPLYVSMAFSNGVARRLKR